MRRVNEQSGREEIIKATQTLKQEENEALEVEKLVLFMAYIGSEGDIVRRF